MDRRIERPKYLRKEVLLVLALALALVLSAIPALAQTAPDYSITGGWFFTQTGGGLGQGFAVRDTGTDANGNTIKFWTEFQRLGGVTTLGYPIGQPYVGEGGFTYQPFQRGALQWRPESGRALLSNTFESLQTGNLENWLYESKGVPRAIANDGSGGDYAKAVATRLAWLTDERIRARFLANPNPQSISSWNQERSIELYGLPMSGPEKHGPFVSQRFQRIAFQVWVEDVAGMPAKGTVVGVLGGELLKEAGLLPGSALGALGPGGSAPLVTPTPTATPTPARPTYPWRVSSVQGWPNCGTTYVRIYARDAAGNGRNGMTIKSWNDWGNEYFGSTQDYQGLAGHTDRVFGVGAQAGRWYLMLVDGNGTQSSDVATIDFTANCDGGVQEVEVEFREN